jgi:type IV pilus assembly protein PilC
MDSRGKETKGTLEVSNQNEAINRLKEMGFFPTKVTEAAKESGKKTDKKAAKGGAKGAAGGAKGAKGKINLNNIKIPFIGGGVKTKVLCTFTRQLATLVDAGLPLLRGLRVLNKQEHNPALKEAIEKMAVSVEGGSTFSEALAQHPKIFNRLFISMVKAGEMGGVLEVVLNRLSEFMEKAEKIKGKVVAAMFYPIAVLCVAVAIIGVLTVFVIPKFEEIFKDMLDGASMPGITIFVLSVSRIVKSNILAVLLGAVAFFILLKLATKTKIGRRWFDKLKLIMPGIGPVITKVAISRFTRTLGTLISSGVPILQALTIVKETSGNVIIGNAVVAIHESVKEGETITAPLEAANIFPPMVISMVDVGEQTGALPEMLMKIADTYDDEVDNAVDAMTSLLEPVMIVFLALVVGTIVIALFAPLVKMMDVMGSSGDDGGKKAAD